jgi:hypothetical protein
MQSGAMCSGKLLILKLSFGEHRVKIKIYVKNKLTKKENKK